MLIKKIAGFLTVIFFGLVYGFTLWAVCILLHKDIGWYALILVLLGFFRAIALSIREAMIEGKYLNSIFIAMIGALEGGFAGGLAAGVLRIVFGFPPGIFGSYTTLFLLVFFGATLGAFFRIRNLREWIAQGVRISRTVVLHQALGDPDANRPKEKVGFFKRLRRAWPKLHASVLIVPIIIWLLAIIFATQSRYGEIWIIYGGALFYSILILFSHYVNYWLINDYIIRHRGDLIGVRWSPFLPGLIGEKWSWRYKVNYADWDGVQQCQYFKVGLFTGVYLTDDES